VDYILLGEYDFILRDLASGQRPADILGMSWRDRRRGDWIADGMGEEHWVADPIYWLFSPKSFMFCILIPLHTYDD